MWTEAPRSSDIASTHSEGIEFMHDVCTARVEKAGGIGQFRGRAALEDRMRLSG